MSNVRARFPVKRVALIGIVVYSIHVHGIKRDRHKLLKLKDKLDHTATQDPAKSKTDPDHHALAISILGHRSFLASS